jgi:hypothetical protein
MSTWAAEIGDGVSVESHRLRGGRRTGTILEVLGSPGTEYYRVRWTDGRETVFHPGPDAVLQPKAPRRRPPPSRPGTRAKPAEPGPVKAPPAPPPVEPRELRATAGDRLVIKGHHLGEKTRDGEVLEVLGEDGRPPFRVRWSDTGREALLFPGADAMVEHFPRAGSRKRAARNA